MKNNEKNNKDKIYYTIFTIVVLITSIIIIFALLNKNNKAEDNEITYTELITKIDQNAVEKIEMTVGSSSVKVKLKNDSKAAGLAEFKYGSLKKYNDAVFLCLGTGIGSAVFLNGELLEANKHVGFELGHIVLDRDGIKCNCGKKGCFETYCSIKRFKENARRKKTII